MQYERRGGYRALRKALQHDARGSSGSGEGIEPARPRRRGFPTAQKWSFRSDGRRCAAARSIWSATPTRWSRAHSRTACCWKAIRTS